MSATLSVESTASSSDTESTESYQSTESHESSSNAENSASSLDIDSSDLFSDLCIESSESSDDTESHEWTADTENFKLISALMSSVLALCIVVSCAVVVDIWHQTQVSNNDYELDGYFEAFFGIPKEKLDDFLKVRKQQHNEFMQVHETIQAHFSRCVSSDAQLLYEKLLEKTEVKTNVYSYNPDAICKELGWRLGAFSTDRKRFEKAEVDLNRVFDECAIQEQHEKCSTFNWDETEFTGFSSRGRHYQEDELLQFNRIVLWIDQGHYQTL